MEIWQLLLVKGNDSFNKQELPLAEDYYHQAIECLEQEWHADLENSSLLMAWISAFHNLAVLYEETGRAKNGFSVFTNPPSTHDRIVTAVSIQR